VDVDTRRKYLKEFSDLGANSVRNEVLVGRWPQDKVVLARQWLEREDVRQWQKTPPKEKVGMSGKQRRMIGYVLAAVGFAFAISRIVRTLKFG
jgi:hypothetical protein